MGGLWTLVGSSRTKRCGFDSRCSGSVFCCAVEGRATSRGSKVLESQVWVTASGLRSRGGDKPACFLGGIGIGI
jgi:hypothetical protein